jgi:TatA/E family protein of Tat protein translocase
MSFAGVGPAELLLILIVALVVFGPERLPKLARDLGKTIGKWRQALDEIQTVADAPADKLLELASKEEEMQESVQQVVEPEDREKTENGEQADDGEKTESGEQAVVEENKGQEPGVES